MAERTHADVLKVDLHTVIERLTLVAPLGLRFWDEVSGKTIGDGLQVTAYSETQPYRRVSACSNPSGIYILHHAPGLRAVENGTGEAAFWDNHPPQWPFIIEVVDRERRFQPFLLRVVLPERVAGGSPPTAMRRVSLYSTPNRSVPAAMAVLRAELWDLHGGRDRQGAPAPWAVLAARLPGRSVVRGIADAQGRIALIFAYPEIVPDMLESPPLSSPVSPPHANTSLWQRSWPITLQAAYAPQDPVPVIPDLDDILTQPSARLWDDDFERTEIIQKQLYFGHELIVRSRADVRGRLFITPAGSPL